MKIYVVYIDYGYEGFSEPLDIFTDEEELDKAIKLASAAHATQLLVKTFDVKVSSKWLTEWMSETNNA